MGENYFSTVTKCVTSDLKKRMENIGGLKNEARFHVQIIGLPELSIFDCYLRK